MRKNQKHEEDEEERYAEILKAVAQAWHGHSSSSRTTTTTSEFDTLRRYFKGKPTRFKLEAMSMATKEEKRDTSWDFRQSLFDTYEIVALSKKLERGITLEDPFSALDDEQHKRVSRKPKEKSNSLRNLFNKVL